MLVDDVEVTGIHNNDEVLEREALNVMEDYLNGVYEDDAEYIEEQQAEVDNLRKQGTFKTITRDEARRRGYTVFKSRWVLISNAEKRKARFVAQQFAGQRSTHDTTYFAATPSLAAWRL